MRTEARELRRPLGAVLRPLGLLAAAVVIGFGMWRVLMRDTRHDHVAIARVVRGPGR